MDDDRINNWVKAEWVSDLYEVRNHIAVAPIKAGQWVKLTNSGDVAPAEAGDATYGLAIDGADTGRYVPIRLPDMVTTEERTEQYLDRIFDLHLLTQDQQDYLAEMRRQTKELARRMMELCPPNAERERAITLLDHALRDAIASVVRR